MVIEEEWEVEEEEVPQEEADLSEDQEEVVVVQEVPVDKREHQDSSEVTKAGKEVQDQRGRDSMPVDNHKTVLTKVVVVVVMVTNNPTQHNSMAKASPMDKVKVTTKDMELVVMTAVIIRLSIQILELEVTVARTTQVMIHRRVLVDMALKGTAVERPVDTTVSRVMMIGVVVMLLQVDMVQQTRLDGSKKWPNSWLYL